MDYALRHSKCGFCGLMLYPDAGQSADLDYCDDACREAAMLQPLTGALAAVLTSKLSSNSPPQRSDLDPITLEVINGALLSICKEMAKTMERSSYSPVFSEGADLTTAIFDVNLNLIAQYEGIPAQMGSMKFGVLGAINEIGTKELDEGDVILHNDSYRGTPHAPEFCMVMPIFWEGEIFGYAANIAHHTDVGGKAPGSMPGDATEIFQEGVIIPPVKVFRQGIEDPIPWKIYLANVRTPYQSYGDAMAMYASLVVCERRVHELLDKYGSHVLALYAAEVRASAERQMRVGIRQIPNGVYTGHSVLEDDGVSDRQYDIHLQMAVLDEDIIFDFRGSSAQAMGPVNSPYGVSVGACANAIFNLVDPTISHNDGTFVPLHFILPAGSVVNCDYPAPLNGGNTESHNIILEAVMGAMAEAVPDRVPAECGSTTSLITGGGMDKHRDPFTFIVWEGSGWGAFTDRDGLTAVTTWVGVGSKTFPAEVLESRYPWRVIRHELRGEPGAGRHRGGLGCEVEYEILSDEFVVSSISCRGRIAPRGRSGGRDGQVTEIRVVRNGREMRAVDLQPNLICPTKFSGLRLKFGDRLIVRSPGGAGYGDPRERDPGLVLQDVRRGYISESSARNIYGLPTVDSR